MSEWRITRSAVWREIYSRRKAFVITTLIALTIVVGGMGLAAILIDADQSPVLAVGVVGQAGEGLEEALALRVDPDTQLVMEQYDDRPEGEDALRAEDISALVVGPYDVLWSPVTPSRMTDAVAGAMRSVNIERVSEELDLSQSDVSRLLAPVRGETIDYEEEDASVEVVAAISVIVMFIAILSYGQWIAYGVVEEKANRVAELVLGALSPGQLLTAKMISLGGMGLLQMVIIGSTAMILGTALTDIAMPAVAGTTMAWLLLWFVMGYAFYGSLYSAAGSLAADSQEAGSVITPLNILPGIGYVVGLIALSEGSEMVSRILSLIPIWAPMVMPGRMAQGVVPWWEITVAIALMAAGTYAMVRFAARVYLGGITQATRKVGWRQAFRGGKDLVST